MIMQLAELACKAESFCSLFSQNLSLFFRGELTLQISSCLGQCALQTVCLTESCV